MSVGATLTPADVIESIRYAAGTDIGVRREENQDSFGVVSGPGFRFYVVADGMGGVNGGAIASSLAFDVINRYLKDKKSISEFDICSAVTEANKAIFERGKKE